MYTAETILVVDDDAEIREIVRVLLESEGYAVLDADSAKSALSVFSEQVSLAILDVMMDGMSGYQLCMKLRERSNIPILFLTAKSQDCDLTTGFAVGGDDYLSKPFSYAELLARVKGLLRRYRAYVGERMPDSPIEYAGLTVRTDRNEVRRNGEEIKLTDKEYQVLLLMLHSRGKVFSAQNLYESVWEEPYLYTSSNTVMVHIRRLREKLEIDPQNPTLIRTVWGKGYCID